jgi:hypothetical protein
MHLLQSEHLGGDPLVREGAQRQSELIVPSRFSRLRSLPSKKSETSFPEANFANPKLGTLRKASYCAGLRKAGMMEE